MYSNSRNPKICPVLDLDKCSFSYTYILTTNLRLFPGNHQYEIFLKIFHKIINGNIEEFQSVGVEKGTLGSHSVRKGAIAIVSSGFTVYPPMAYICLRDFWSMGPIKYRYILYEKASDQFVGRSVTGISLMITKFGVYPVHWDWTDSPVGSKYEMVVLIEDNFVRRTDVSSSTFEIIQFYLHVYAFIILTQHAHT